MRIGAPASDEDNLTESLRVMTRLERHDVRVYASIDSLGADDESAKMIETALGVCANLEHFIWFATPVALCPASRCAEAPLAVALARSWR